ncbi:hypothetical protein [Streptomyces sp. NPDC048603]|uniref:hypothetical protein n=1 Tax=Streptomyces sp. NPDC048603 TaxID=3365577 RepID=UPI003714CA8C
MSFEAEWARQKAVARTRLAAGPPATRLNSAGSGGGSGAGAAGADSLVADRSSINGNANLLVEIAALLHEGRPDGEAATMARAPRAHEDVAEQVLRFSRFADDQYQDTVALFAALGTRLRTAGTQFAGVDDDTARAFLDRLLSSGRYAAPEDR